MHEAIADCISVDRATFSDRTAEEEGAASTAAADPREHACGRAVNHDRGARGAAGDYEASLPVVSYARRSKRDSIAAWRR